MIKDYIITEEISSVHVDWVSGDLQVIKHDSSDIKIIEDVTEGKESEIKVLGNALYVKEKRFNVMSIFDVDFHRKSLTVCLPEKIYDCIEISTVSSKVDIQDLQTEILSASVISGNISIDKFSGGKMGISSVSGKISGDSIKACEVGANTKSGNINLEFIKIPDEVELSTISGNISIRVPENNGFTVKVDKVSGKFDSDFALQTEDKRYIYKNGQSRFRVSVVSGKIKITRGIDSI